MWPLLAVVIALMDVVTSRTESLNFNNDNMPLRLTNLNALQRPELEQLNKLESSANVVGPSLDDLFKNVPFRKLSTLEDIDGITDERVPPIEEDVDTDIDQLSAFLTQLLQEPGSWEAPLVLVEEPIPWEGSPMDNPGVESAAVLPAPWKRSRYYRRYPWKRQNSRTRYDDGSRYLCTPTREDVFQLLVALHDARQGNKSRTVNFCNRRRPAGAIFTNIRFLGRRK